MLYTKIDAGIGLVANHNSIVRDSHPPVEIGGSSTYEVVWRYMLGIGCSTSGIAEQSLNQELVYPNPASEKLIITST